MKVCVLRLNGFAESPKVDRSSHIRSVCLFGGLPIPTWKFVAGFGAFVPICMLSENLL